MDSYFAFGMVDSFACLNIYSYYKRMEAEVKGVGRTGGWYLSFLSVLRIGRRGEGRLGEEYILYDKGWG